MRTTTEEPTESSQAKPGEVCPLCGDDRLSGLFALPHVPVHVGVQWPSASEARACPRGDIRLVVCEGCGFIHNAAFVPELMAYTGRYENSLHFSSCFQDYARGLASHLTGRYDLRDKDIIEIGCGDGRFLALLASMGGNRGVGFDPSLRSSPPAEMSDDLTFVARSFTQDDSHYPVDLLCCRQVLEHIPDPVGFLRMIRGAIGSRLDAAVFFEVPDFIFALQHLSGWDIVYEHCSYFGPQALTRALLSADFDVLDLQSYYGGAFIGIEAKPRPHGGECAADRVVERDALGETAVKFAAQWPKKVDGWRERLAGYAEADKRTVVWGAGARSTTFLNILDAHSTIDYVVDLNPRKHGLFLPGTGHRIASPEHVVDESPDVVILTNPIYENEVRQALRERGCDAIILAA